MMLLSPGTITAFTILGVHCDDTASGVGGRF
jgi:hypothetical protein